MSRGCDTGYVLCACFTLWVPWLMVLLNFHRCAAWMQLHISLVPIVWDLCSFIWFTKDFTVGDIAGTTTGREDKDADSWSCHLHAGCFSQYGAGLFPILFLVSWKCWWLGHLSYPPASLSCSVSLFWVRTDNFDSSNVSLHVLVSPKSSGKASLAFGHSGLII